MNQSGTCPVSLRLTVAGARADVATGVRCRPADWAGGHGPLRKSHPEHEADADTLEALRRNAKVAKQRLEALGRPVTPQAVAALLRNPKALQPGPPPCLLGFMEAELTAHYAPGNRATFEAMRAIVAKLRAFAGPGALPLAAFSTSRAAAFYQRLLAAKARGGEVRTANKAVIQLTALFRRGIAPGLWAEADNPFAGVKKKPDAKREKVRLTATELAAVLALDLDPAGWLWRARCVYRLQFYLLGERIGACLLLRWADVRQQDTAVRYQAQKGGPFKQVPVHAALAELLAELAPRRAAGRVFVLPYLADDYPVRTPHDQLQAVKAATAVVNKALKAVAALAGVDKPLRSHAARHTFATILARSAGAAYAQQALGHTTLKQTQAYIAEFDQAEMHEAAGKVFGLFGPPAPGPAPPVRYYSVELRRGVPRAHPLLYAPQLMNTGRLPLHYLTAPS